MENTATLNLRVNSKVKHDAEDVLGRLGLSMSTAVGMFLRQVAMTQSIPFAVSIPQAPASVDLSSLSDEQLGALLRSGISDAANGVKGATLDELRAELL